MMEHYALSAASTLLVLIVLLLPRGFEFVTVDVVRRNVTYVWKTGHWGTCYTPNKCGEGRRERQVWCFDSTGFISLESNCIAATRPAPEDDCFRVCPEHKQLLRWRVSEWSNCVPLLKGRRSPKRCQDATGMARRNVSCAFISVDGGGRSKVVDSHACEYFWDRPEAAMACSMECPQDCVVSDFSPWTMCPNCGSQQKSRVRQVIVAPQAGGKSCPVLSDILRCNDTLNDCLHHKPVESYYHIKVSQWGPCIFQEHSSKMHAAHASAYTVHPSLGLRKRNVTCINEHGRRVELSLCDSNKISLPHDEEFCIVPIDCSISPWSEWKVEREGCISSEGHVFPERRTRIRRLLRFSEGEGLPCPPLWETRLIEKDLPSCYKYKWMALEWGECIVIDQNGQGNIEILKPTCGGGVQKRNLTCLRISDQIPVSHNFCKETRPKEIQRCNIPCRRDCLVSQWSRWGPCLPYNVTDYFGVIESGFRKRERSPLVEPSGDGKPCPHLQEVIKCEDLEMFSWQYGNWSECKLHRPEKKCGDGEMTRDSTCVKYNGSPIGNPLCHHHLQIVENTDICFIPCPEDCVLSEWSEWSPCSRPCSMGHRWGGTKRNRTIIAPSGIGGRPCDKEEMLEEDSCNHQSCATIKWTTSEWGPCENTRSNSSCGEGIQWRQVFCTDANDKYKDFKLCALLSQPPKRRSCYIPCPVDCIVTKFSDWTPCPSQCDSDDVQYREQFIVQRAQYGGKSCPVALKEARPCSTKNELLCLKRTDPSSETFRWILGPWSKCTLPYKSEACEMGFQIRNLTCIHGNDHPVEPSNCLKPLILSSNNHLLSPVPDTIRQCEITCSPICTFSTWTSWSSCEDGYVKKRIRTRELLDGTSGNETCESQFSLLEEEDCRPQQTDDLPEGEHWMSCIVSEGNMTAVAVNGQLVLHSCGQGYRYKTGLEISLNRMLLPGAERDMCFVDCPLDCQMSEWSSWSPCEVHCGQGYRQRRRSVVIAANQLGRPCPPTEGRVEVQSDVCSVPCVDFRWSAGGWRNCILHKGRGDPNIQCGNGTQHRSVRCIDKRMEEVVEDYRCDPFFRPERTRQCRLYCPGECVVSAWSQWTQCTDPCSIHQTRHRTRHVLRHPSPTSSLGCPNLREQEPCIMNKTCFKHTWSLGKWSSCNLPPGAVCGEGVQRRPLLCFRSDGRQVDSTRCEKLERPLSLIKPTSKPCYIDCPIDCVMSEWSEWNTSQCGTCGQIDEMTRFRVVLQSQSDAGQPCAPELLQRKPCEFKLCYQWRASPWSFCDLKGANCGYGIRRRSIQCIRSDGVVVDKIHCLIVNITFQVNSWIDSRWLKSAQDQNEEEPCYIHCPGDCILTEWSVWSHCHKDCDMGQTVGYQTQSRAILAFPSAQNGERCPHRLWRIRPCWDKYCYTFSWKGQNGTWQCVRSDGLLVEGGCKDKPRPCYPSCEERQARCDPALGQCYCEPGLTPLLESASVGSGRLLRCAMLQVMDPVRNPANHTGPTPEVVLKYYPDDSEASFWMYAMISIGTAFVIFVFVTVYLMCRSTIRRRMISVQRQASVRRRATSPEEALKPCH